MKGINLGKSISVVLVLILAMTSASCSRNRIASDKSAVPHKYGMMRATFGEYASVTDAVKNECHMEELLNSSIQSTNSRIGLDINIVNNKAELNEFSDVLNVQFDSVDSHTWRFGSFRPASVATVSVEIVSNGKVVKTVKKNISSMVSFTACGRLDKIAKSAGVFVAKWTHKVRY